MIYDSSGDKMQYKIRIVWVVKMNFPILIFSRYVFGLKLLATTIKAQSHDATCNANCEAIYIIRSVLIHFFKSL